MTATRDRRSDLDDDPGVLPWDQRPIFGNSRGVPWWAAVLLAVVTAVIGMYVDTKINNAPGRIFQGAYVVGCVVAVCWVQRRSLFGPMVQPPLILVTTVPTIMLMAMDIAGDGLTGKALSVGQAMINMFPTMAGTTVITVGLGTVRLLVQRAPKAVNPDAPAGRPARQRPGGQPSAGRAAGDGHPERAPRVPRGEQPSPRPERTGRPNRVGRQDGGGQADRAGRPGGLGGPDPVGRSDRAARPDRANRPNPAERPERGAQRGRPTPPRRPRPRDDGDYRG